jgi:hypothetical protein
MLKRTMIGLMALALSAGLTLTACGDDDPAGNNGGTNNGAADAGDTNGGGGDDAGDTTPEPDAEEQGCTTDEDCSPGFMCETTTGECVAAPSGCELTGEDRPARCDETFEDTEFGPGSLITSFQIAGANDDGGSDCCFDYNADQDHSKATPGIDNALGVTLDGLALGDINDGLQESIDSGDLLLVFEHDGLTGLDAGDDYALNFFLGEYDVDDNLLIDPASIDDGTYPQARVENASITDGVLTAGPGIVKLTIDLLGTPLTLVISDAQIEANIDAENSSMEDGVAMTEGKLGGVIRVTDVLEAVNTYAATSCECLGLEGEPLIHYNPENIGCYAEDPNSPEEGMYDGKECGCNPDITPSACEGTCSDLGGSYCGLVYSIIPSLSDVDTDSDGEPDAVSIGANFSTEAANFTGIAAE